MGILAALAVPALKNFGHADAMTAADQQMLGDVARARQLAISQRTTVYMVFVPASFWYGNYGTFPNGWWTGLTAGQRNTVTNLCDKQLTGYTVRQLRRGGRPARTTPVALPRLVAVAAGRHVHRPMEILSAHRAFPIQRSAGSRAIFFGLSL